MWGFSQSGGQAVRLVVVSCAVLVAVAVAAGGVGAAGATAAAAPKVCKEAGITLGVVHKVFGASARIGGEGDSETGRCALQSGVGSQPPSNCMDGPPTCINTDVTLQPASAYSGDVADTVEELNSYGHAHKSKFSGAGPEAVLLTSPSGYGEVTNPVVLCKAGPKTVSIAGPFAGEGQTRAVYNQWEALARKIYAHLARH